MSENKVGYKRPPRQRQFKKGQSGNPRGRPKTKAATLAMPADFAEMVLVQAERKVPAVENGRTVEVSITEGVLRRLGIDALKGDKKAAALFLRLLETALTIAKLNPTLRPQPAPDMANVSAQEAVELYRKFIRGE